jgi:hypothetical protein
VLILDNVNGILMKTCTKFVDWFKFYPLAVSVCVTGLFS